MTTVARAALDARRWDEYVDGHEGGWFWHRGGWIDYQLAYRAGNADESFALLGADGQVAGVIPLVVTTGADGAREASYSGEPFPYALVDADSDVAASHAELRAIQRRTGFRRVVLAPSFVGAGAAAPVIATSGAPALRTIGAAQRVVSLGADMWAGVRRSYRALIHAAERRWAVRPWGADGFGRYAALHARVHGSPRPPETYRLQREWLAGGLALLVLASEPGADDAVGAAYWIAYKRAAYYASGAYAADDVAHGVIWQSLLALQAAGVARASLGWQGRAVTEKERGIEFFKRGFGGADVPVPITVVDWKEAE